MRRLLAILLLCPALAFGHGTPPPVVRPPVGTPAPVVDSGSPALGWLVFAFVGGFFYVAICTKEREVNPEGWFAKNCAFWEQKPGPHYP